MRTARVAALFALFCSLTACLAAAERPNIVFLFADDQCAYSMGCYGNKDVKTPNLDQLAPRRMVFDNHYDTTAICMASPANVMCGMLEYKTGCNFEHGPLLEEHWRRTYPMLLRAAGYRTGFAGKFGFVVASKPGAKGRLPESDFDAWGGGPRPDELSNGAQPFNGPLRKTLPAFDPRVWGVWRRLHP